MEFGATRRFKVEYRIIGTDEIHVKTVSIIDGYTTEADIPQIIAVSRTGRQSDKMFIVIESKELLSTSA